MKEHLLGKILLDWINRKVRVRNRCEQTVQANANYAISEIVCVLNSISNCIPLKKYIQNLQIASVVRKYA